MYRLTESPEMVTRLSDGASIPSGHRWWVDYQTWLADGNTPSPCDVKSPVVITKDTIAARRYLAEVSGMNFNGVLIPTDDRSKLLITGAALEATIDPSYTMQWKTSQGFVPLESADIIFLARAVRAHVQSCFDREGELLYLLELGELLPDMLEEGWPNERLLYRMV